MPKPICGRCARELQMIRAGAVVQFNAAAVNGPYEQWHSDCWECPTCGARIFSGYGTSATWHAFDVPKTPPAVPDVVVLEHLQRNRT